MRGSWLLFPFPPDGLAQSSGRARLMPLLDCLVEQVLLLGLLQEEERSWGEGVASW